MTVASGPISIICGYNAYGYVRPCLIDEYGALVVSGGSSDMDASDVTYTPTTPADWDGGIDPGNQNAANDQLAERVKDLEDSAFTLIYPRYFYALWASLGIVTGEPFTGYIEPTQFLSSFWSQQPGAQYDTTEIECYLAAGNYTLEIMGSTASGRGIVTISHQLNHTGSYTTLDTTLDFYSAVNVSNVIKTCNFTLSVGGLYRFRFGVNSKNASSVGYVMRATYLCIRPQ